MKLSYVDVLGDGARRPITVEITTDHHMSSYGQPVIILPGGELLNAESWYLMAYQVQQATPDELELMRRWLNIVSLWTETNAAKALGKLGGQVTSAAKKKSSAENGRKGGRPKKAKE